MSWGRTNRGGGTGRIATGKARMWGKATVRACIGESAAACQDLTGKGILLVVAGTSGIRPEARGVKQEGLNGFGDTQGVDSDDAWRRLISTFYVILSGTIGRTHGLELQAGRVHNAAAKETTFGQEEPPDN